MSLTATIHTDWQSLESARAAWSAWSGHRFMGDWPWLRGWWESFGSRSGAAATWRGEPRRQLAVVTAHDSASGLLGIAPFYVARGYAHRSLRLLGDGLATSDYVGILAAPDCMAECAKLIASTLAGADFCRYFGPLDSIQFEGQTADDAWLVPFWSRLAELGWQSERWEIEGAWQVRLPATWDAYLAHLGPSHRRKARRMITRGENDQIRTVVASEPAMLEDYWPHFVGLHQRRRRELGQPGCFADPRFEHFLRAAALEFAARGKARMVLGLVDAEPIAAALYFEQDGALALYQSGFDSRFAQLEPGHRVNAMALQDAIQRGIHIFDFLRGDEPYKQLWKAERVPLYRWRGVSPRWQARLKHSAWSILRKMKHTGQSLASSIQQRVKPHVSNSTHPVS